MRLLLTAHRYWPHVGGTEEVVQQLATRVAARGHEVTVATMQEPGTPAVESRGGVRIVRFAMRQVGRFRFPPRAYREFVTRPEWDVVHVHGQRVWSSDYLYRRFKRIPAPIVFTAHGFYQYHMERAPLVNDWYYHVVLPRVLRRTAAVTALTQNERRELLSWGVPSALVRVVPDGFDAGEFASLPTGFRKRHGFPDEGPLLLSVGGLYRNKRVDHAIDAAAALGGRIPLAIVGRDPDGARPALERRAARKGVDARFLGVLPREDVLSAYREATLFLFPSAFEGFGLALLEAMAAGLPFVASRAGAAPDLAALGAGVLADSPEEAAARARELIVDEPRRRAMGGRAREAVQAFAWEPIVERYLALYEEVQRR